MSQRLALLSIDVDELWKRCLPAPSRWPPASPGSVRQAATSRGRFTACRISCIRSSSRRSVLCPPLRGHCREVSQQSIHVQFSRCQRAEHAGRAMPRSVCSASRRKRSPTSSNTAARPTRGSCCRAGMARSCFASRMAVAASTRTSLSDGLGLMSMRERVHLVGGDITVSSTPNRGTVIEARVPVHASPLRPHDRRLPRSRAHRDHPLSVFPGSSRHLPSSNRVPRPLVWPRRTSNGTVLGGVPWEISFSSSIR